MRAVDLDDPEAVAFQKTAGGVPVVPLQVHVDRVVAISPLEPAEQPREAVVDFDVVRRKQEPFLADEARPGLMSRGVIPHVTTGFGERGATATAGAQDEHIQA